MVDGILYFLPTPMVKRLKFMCVCVCIAEWDLDLAWQKALGKVYDGTSVPGKCTLCTVDCLTSDSGGSPEFALPPPEELAGSRIRCVLQSRMRRPIGSVE